MIREAASFAAAALFVAVVVFWWLTAAHSARVRRVRRQYQILPHEVREQILDRINTKGLENSVCSVMVATNTVEKNDEIRQSHYGGIPYAEANDIWPTLGPDSSEPAEFLIQVLLDESFPPPWRGRLVCIFSNHDVDQTVRTYTTPSPERFIAMTGGPAPQFEWKLKTVRIPRQLIGEDTGAGDARSARAQLLDYDPVVLLDSVPELRTQLVQYTQQPADLLAAVLAPNHCGYGFELSDIVQLGGRPVWLLEGLEGLDCDRCGCAMRFLFQFGDLNGGGCLGESGVCYVFGCDEDPELPRGIVQMC